MFSETCLLALGLLPPSESFFSQSFTQLILPPILYPTRPTINEQRLTHSLPWHLPRQNPWDFRPLSPTHRLRSTMKQREFRAVGYRELNCSLACMDCWRSEKYYGRGVGRGQRGTFLAHRAISCPARPAQGPPAFPSSAHHCSPLAPPSAPHLTIPKMLRTALRTTLRTAKPAARRVAYSTAAAHEAPKAKSDLPWIVRDPSFPLLPAFEFD